MEIERPLCLRLLHIHGQRSIQTRQQLPAGPVPCCAVALGSAPCPGVLGLVGIGKGLQESSLLAVGVQSGLMLTLARVVVASRAGALLCSRVRECALALSATGLVGVCGLVNSRVAC